LCQLVNVKLVTLQFIFGRCNTNAMQIKFTNFKRNMLILGTFVFLLGTLFIISVIVKNKRENAEKVSQISPSITPSQGINETGGTNAETEESLTRFLSSKTELIAVFVNSSTDNFLEDPVFQGMSRKILDRILSETNLLDAPISVSFRKVIINSDKRSGTTYATFTSKSGKVGNFEFIYSKNVENEWKLVDFVASKLIQTTGESTTNP